jgi:hypothetical protein
MLRFAQHDKTSARRTIRHYAFNNMRGARD